MTRGLVHGLLGLLLALVGGSYGAHKGRQKGCLVDISDRIGVSWGWRSRRTLGLTQTWDIRVFWPRPLGGVVRIDHTFPHMFFQG